ncbi:zinc ribbon domain-containing protein [Variovorax sp. PDNC026]|nr:zinc ribbon domain-containing protein [Variovorax sp. PMC12]QRY32814.1 zinc ribbon domain-containing protein [Variovorax sp. PDNC026]
MALICPVCSTENRDGANFCRSCGATLSGKAARIPPPPSPEREWATTAPAQLRAPTIPAPLFDPRKAEPGRSFFGRSPTPPPSDDQETVVMVYDDPPPPPPAPSSGFETARPEKAERKRTRVKVRRPVERPPRKRVILLWLGLLAVAVLMMVAGWYGYGTSKAPAAVTDPGPAVSAPPVEPATPPAEPAPPTAQAPAAPQPPAAEAPPVAEAAPPAASTRPAARPRKQATVSAPAPGAAETPAPAVAAAPPPPAPAPPAPEPLAQCGDRNFIARAQCMAAQCLKAEYKAHSQCEAVRRQQRIDEEKRNPTLIN